MKILHIYGHSYGGNFVITQLKELVAQGHDVYVICPAKGKFTEIAEQVGVSVIVSDFQGAKLADLFKIAKSILFIRKVIKTLNIDVVHYHLIKAILVGRIACLGLSKITKISELGGPLTLEMRRFRWLDIATAFIDDYIICSSYAIERIYQQYKVTRNKLKVLHYAFPLTPFLSVDKSASRTQVRNEFSIDEQNIVIGMVAYLYASNFRQFKNVGLKGHETLIDAAADLVKTHPNLTFLIVGQDIDGGTKYLQALQNRVANLGLESHFIFAGYRSDVANMISAMDIVAVPSLSENCGGAVEPLMMSVPVVASNVGGLTDIVIENETGWLCEPANTQSLASSLKSAIDAGNIKRKDMGENGKRLVSSLFDPVINGKKLAQIYQSKK